MKKVFILLIILLTFILIGGTPPENSADSGVTKTPLAQKDKFSGKCIKNIQRQQTKLLYELKQIKQNIEKIKKANP
tara:strand:- start:996 stop:1223 length:228 start_codon:yes stop_codon:yes gene_type:complete